MFSRRTTPVPSRVSPVGRQSIAIKRTWPTTFLCVPDAILSRTPARIVHYSRPPSFQFNLRSADRKGPAPHVSHLPPTADVTAAINRDSDRRDVVNGRGNRDGKGECVGENVLSACGLNPKWKPRAYDLEYYEKDARTVEPVSTGVIDVLRSINEINVK